jgi:hypothetical protein
MTTRYYYAATYPLGSGMHDSRTMRPIRTIVRFASAAERDAWVSGGAAYQSYGDYREALTARAIRVDVARSAAASPMDNGLPLWVGDNDYAGEALA